MQLTLTIHGTPAEIRAVLDAITLGHPADDDLTGLRAFIWDCTGPMLAAVNVVAYPSAGGQAIGRAGLQRDANLADEGELNGVMGSIGRAWAKHVGTANPFLGKQTSDGTFYRIDEALASTLIGLVAERTAAMAGS